MSPSSSSVRWPRAGRAQQAVILSSKHSRSGHSGVWNRLPRISPTEKRLNLLSHAGKITKSILNSTRYTPQPLIPVLKDLHVDIGT